MTDSQDPSAPKSANNGCNPLEQSKTELYRRKAGECLIHADRMTSAEDKANWLMLAESWQKLADRTETTYDIGDVPAPGGSDATAD